MTYSIIGFGAVGQALAKMFARKGVHVTVATTKSPDTLVEKAKAIGSNVVPKTLEDALRSEVILLAVPFWAHREVAETSSNWRGKTIVDVTNSYGVSAQELDGLPSSAVVARAFKDAKLVKAFNHLAAQTLALDPAVGGGRRAIFLSSDQEHATKPVVELVEQLGFAPVLLGDLETSGRLVQAHGKTWAPLIFQNLVKFD